MMKDGKCCPMGKLSMLLLIVGGLNWGLWGLMELNLVEKLLGSVSWLEKLVYVLVGLAALYMLAMCCKGCKGGSCGMKKEGSM